MSVLSRQSPARALTPSPLPFALRANGRGAIAGLAIGVSLLGAALFSGCRGNDSAARDSSRSPAQPSATVVPTHPSENPGVPAVQWDLEYLVALCPGCHASLDYHATSCERCKRECRWVMPEIPNTPEGAFTALKLAALYDDVEFYRLALVAEDAARFERSIRLGGPAPLGSREQAIETRVKNVLAAADSAILRIEYRGHATELTARPENGRWKISLAQTETAARMGAAKEFVQGLELAIVQYITERGAPPATGNTGLVAALSQPSSSGQPYYWLTQTSLNEKGELLDPWGHPVVYTIPAIEAPAVGTTPGESAKPTDRKYSLYLTGPNGIDEKGAGDDVGP